MCNCSSFISTAFCILCMTTTIYWPSLLLRDICIVSSFWLLTNKYGDSKLVSRMIVLVYLLLALESSYWKPLIFSDLNLAVLVVAVNSLCLKFAFFWLSVTFEHLHLFICYSLTGRTKCYLPQISLAGPLTPSSVFDTRRKITPSRESLQEGWQPQTPREPMVQTKCSSVLISLGAAS